MLDEIKEKYTQLKAENPNLDSEMVLKFFDDMPKEAMLLLNKMIYGCHIVDRKLYNEATSLFKWSNKEGVGCKWDVEELAKISKINFDEKKYYEMDYAYVANMLYSDYCHIFTDPTYYVKMAQAYLEDEDYYGHPDERAYKDAIKRTEYFKKEV